MSPRVLWLPPVKLIPEDMPAEIRDLVVAYREAAAAAGATHQAAVKAPFGSPGYGPAQEVHEEALRKQEAAHNALSSATRRNPRAIADSCAGSFAEHVERGAAKLREAEGEFRAAAAAAAMYATAVARPGQPLLEPTERIERECEPRRKCMSLAATLRNTQLPGPVEG
jgi:hypothetical protein